jgi:hypothetical protein
MIIRGAERYGAALIHNRGCEPSAQHMLVLRALRVQYIAERKALDLSVLLIYIPL